MDRTEIKRLFGAKHVAEIEALTNGASLPSGLGLKNPKVTLILSIFLGMFGIDRLYQSGVKGFPLQAGNDALLAGNMVAGGYWIFRTYDTGGKLQEDAQLLCCLIKLLNQTANQ